MIHLRIRTEFSFKQTFAKVSRCVERLKSIGTTHAAIVDTEGSWGHVAWHNSCRKAGIVPILGIELVVSEEEDVVTKMFFLAKNPAGLREMYRFSSLAFRQKIKTKFKPAPRLFKADVLDIVATGNVYVFAGEILDEEFLVKCNAILDLSPASRILNMSKESLAKRTGLRIVNTGDNFYAFPEDKESFELTEGRNKPSPQHIVELKQELKLSDGSSLEFEDYDLPKAPMIHLEGDLEKLCADGIKYREIHRGLRWSDTYRARLKRELDLIRSKDFDSYFLIVSNMVIWAKERMLVGPSRGSSAGSLVCYLTRITEIDPVKTNLVFERFIDESRKDLPDIDIDFPGEKRHLIFEYMREKYKNVANIGTVSRFAPKSALKQTCSKLGIPEYATAGLKASMLSYSSGDARYNHQLLDSLEKTDAGQKIKSMYPDIVRACVLEGHAQHTGRHAAGLLLCNDLVENYCTVTDDGTAHVEKVTAEALNLLKVDVLGLTTLDIIEEAEKSIVASNPDAPKIDWYGMEMTDKKVFDIFNSGKLCGIFQFEGQSLRNLSSQLHFEDLELVDNVTALARPGPFGGGVTADWLERRKGKEYKAFHPLVERHMENTYGLPVYQEQTMAIVREIGKFDWTKVSHIRKIVSLKKGKEFFVKYFPEFEQGAISQGMTSEEARRTWEYIDSMGAYQMNKAHTWAYAMISYWTAWVKAYHPTEFALASMRHRGDEDARLTMLQEMVREGLNYQPFNVATSKASWSIVNGALVAGFDSLHGFGPSKSPAFAEARDKGTLTDSQKDQLSRATSVFNDLFPMHSKYKKYYDDWRGQNLLDKPANISEITEDNCSGQSFIMIGRILDKNLRDYNEDVNVKKRGGKKARPGEPVLFIDFRIADDTGRVQCRVDRFKYETLGKKIFESKIGTVVMVRADFLKDRKKQGKGIRFGFVKNLRVIEAIEEIEVEEEQEGKKVKVKRNKEILPPVPEKKWVQVQLFEDDPD